MFRNAYISISSILDIILTFSVFLLVYQTIFTISEMYNLSYLKAMYENYVHYVLYAFTLFAITQFGGVNLCRRLIRHLFKPGEFLNFYWIKTTDTAKKNNTISEIASGQLISYSLQRPSEAYKTQFLDPDEYIWVANIKKEDQQLAIPVSFLIGATTI